MTKKERKIVEELKSISTFYNHWSIESCRMALWDVQQKLKELMGENNGR
mgnify:CR=1 FL=1